MTSIIKRSATVLVGLSTLSSFLLGQAQHDVDDSAQIDPVDIAVPNGFKVDLVYSVPKDTQGSWVGLTVDPKGRIIAADQYGSLYRLTLADGKTTQVEPIKATLPALGPGIPESEVGAHGVLYAFDSLYVMVGETDGKRGVWRLKDSNNDDQFDQADFLVPLVGGGEHGPHSMVVSPDGKYIYICAGNFTEPPATLGSQRGVEWDEDHLLPRMWDARGHAKGRYAPGGWIARCNPDGSELTLFAHGFRNIFDIAFDQNGELFTFDSDMEWDQGTPWYMPTRINHAVDGADFGWRSGAGRWPAYYADSLPATINIGPGSPTGTTMGTGTKFPAKYQRALFAADWTFGTLYAIHHEPDGATFRGIKEEFAAGKPLPLTDVIVNPHDGALYFAVGGRLTQSALFRISYIGIESTAPVKAIAPTKAAILRRELETYHTPNASHEAVDEVWPHLSDPDRFIRWAARVSLEHQPTSNWAKQALEEENPTAKIEALIALARVGETQYQGKIVDSLLKLDFKTLPEDQKLPYLRAWQLTFTRMGEPDANTKEYIVETLDPLFPQDSRNIDRELLSLLVYLDSPTVVEKAVPLLRVEEPQVATSEELGGESLIARNSRYSNSIKRVKEHSPDRQQIFIAYAIKNATAGWTPELRREFFNWFATTHEWKGGASFSGFLKNIRNDALEAIAPEARYANLESISQPAAHVFVQGSIPPEGPGQIYTVDSAMSQIPSELTDRDFERGKSMYLSTACVMCHKFNDVGGGIGPDISGAGNRYSIRDLLESIIEPSKVVSDQYGFERITLKNGTDIIGRIVEEDSTHYSIMTNPMLPDEKRGVRKNSVVSIEPHEQSMMPQGLINGLNPEELQDLVAYLLSGGNPEDPMFKKGN
ncbi:c-type cytochrome [Pelagicoccus sp. SDUM812002]|uniref:c-type cytochrome n=1 Tax=Pelagicoccus sp. SDUM812002 TaxID=3041266 RepID=UPI00280F0586|nr:c-type cytochrome [Pelagicoccus sp. SDUM812002]MDQ8184637.1 c-type cytochrome [Pelagicoccus sp. SDUM812002]